MKLRHLLVPAAVAVLAVAPVAATTAAQAADDHAKTYVDTDTATPANPVNIVKVKAFTTSTDFRVVVSYKRYSALPATRYSIATGSADDAGESGNLLDLRIAPSGRASLLAYGVGEDDQLVKSSCHGNRVFSGKNTLTFVIAQGCWYSQYSPVAVLAGTRHYASAAAYAKGTPLDPYRSLEETSTSDFFRSSPDDGWDWGGPRARTAPKHAPLSRLHM